MGGTATKQRLYRGLTLDERRSRRREQLLAAGLEVFARDGWAGSTVLDVCRGAGLSQRYFYEDFDAREELFEAVVSSIEDEVSAGVRAAFTGPQGSAAAPSERIAAALGAVADIFIASPAKARVAVVESMATERFRERRERSLARFAELAAAELRALAASGADRRGIEIAAFVLVGGIAETLVASVTGRLGKSRAELVTQTTRLFLAAAGIDDQRLGDAPASSEQGEAGR